MEVNFSEYSKAASKIVEEFPDVLHKLDVWISHVESSQDAMAESVELVSSAEVLRDNFASILDSVERGTIIGSAEPTMDAQAIVETLKHASDSLEQLAVSVESAPSVKGVSRVESVELMAHMAKAYASSVEEAKY